MRNVFDQYHQAENRLTHALLFALDVDKSLLRRFMKWLGFRNASRRSLSVIEQQLPGEESARTEDEAEARGLPDGCIHDDERWALIIESKIRASPREAQLHRHIRSLVRRGFQKPDVLWLTVLPVGGRLIQRCINRTWSDVYAWLQDQVSFSRWAEHCVRYFEVFELPVSRLRTLRREL